MSDDFIKARKLLAKIKELNLNQFNNSENINKILEILADLNYRRQQELVNLTKEKLLANADGEQLDEIGRQLNVPRYSSDDTEYRTRLYLAAKSRSTKITREDIIELAILASGDTDVKLYLGERHRVDLTVNDGQLSTKTSKEIEKYLPIGTSLKVVGVLDKYFGFGTISNSGDPDAVLENGRYIKDDSNALGFGTTQERNSSEIAGAMSSLSYTNRG